MGVRLGLGFAIDVLRPRFSLLGLMTGPRCEAKLGTFGYGKGARSPLFSTQFRLLQVCLFLLRASSLLGVGRGPRRT